MNKKTILLTFDYELFLGGRSGTPQNCILLPTNKLLNVFSSLDIKGTFFVDILYYLRLLESTQTIRDAISIRDQIREIVSQGSRVELHLHPHWLDAKYTNGQWEFPVLERYRLQSIPENQICNLFYTGINALKEILEPIDPSYKVEAFRAGGFCIQPFTKLKESFISNGVIIDSSVSSGLSGSSQVHSYDFLDAPSIEIYKFTNDPILPEKTGLFYEVPITTYRKSFFSKLALKYQLKRYPMNFKSYGDGTGFSIDKQPWWHKLKSGVRQFSLDGAMIPSEVVSRIKNSNKDLINFVSHTKSLNSNSFSSIRAMAEMGYSFETLTKSFLQKYYNSK
jgi:hypothetical protein